MKRAVLLVLIVLFLTGCSKENISFDVSFNNDDFKVASPYKKGIASSYVVSNVLNNYDPKIVQTDLMMLSASYFKTNNSFYENGQYLSDEFIKKNLEFLNSEQVIFNSIIEQNYKASNGNLKGLSVGLVVNPFVSSKNDLGTYKYEPVVVSKDSVKKAVDYLLLELRKIPEFDKKRIVIGVFYQNEPSKVFPGTFNYIGSTFSSSINLNNLSYGRELLTSDFTKKHDVGTYNLFKEVSDSVKKINKNSVIQGVGLYYDEKVKKIDIEINGVFQKAEIIYLADSISNEISKDYHTPADIEIKIKNNKELEVFIIKRSDSLKTVVEILRG